MEFKFVLGVDMSKDFFNYTLMSSDFTVLAEGKIDNTEQAIFNFISQLLQDYLKTMSEVLLLMEHTGIYVQTLSNCWLSKEGKLSIIPADKVSTLLNGAQGWTEKTDQLDARRLAEYGFRYADQLQLWQAKAHNLELLKRLHRQRSRLIDVINILQVPVKESLAFDSADISQIISDNQSQSIKALKEDLKRIERQIKQLIQQDETLSRLFELITSVPGVGPVTATEVILCTEAFDKFSPNQAKAFSRYSGVVPLQKQSGKKKGRARTSKKANQKMKKLLTMGAVCMIGTHSDLGHYYERKIKEGKAHFSVINAMRNKLILRIFAVVRNQLMYDQNLNVS